MNKRTRGMLVSFAIAGAIIFFAWIACVPPESPSAREFDGNRAYQDVVTQVQFGPRTPGSDGHARTRAWIASELEAAAWSVTVHASMRMGHSIINISATRGPQAPKILLGAHYDTRLVADQDPDPARRGDPVPGANDGASGVAVLLELARSLPQGGIPVWLVFFDAEDNGRIEGWDWILGSREFAEEFAAIPQAVIIVDMVGDENLELYFERNSDAALRSEIWGVAAALDHEEFFIPQEKYSMLDDHTPFLEAGVPAVDIIDFDYPHWHTTEDTADKVSAGSLQIVGETLHRWIALQAE